MKEFLYNVIFAFVCLFIVEFVDCFEPLNGWQITFIVFVSTIIMMAVCKQLAFSMSIDIVMDTMDDDAEDDEYSDKSNEE